MDPAARRGRNDGRRQTAQARPRSVHRPHLEARAHGGGDDARVEGVPVRHRPESSGRRYFGCGRRRRGLRGRARLLPGARRGVADDHRRHAGDGGTDAGELLPTADRNVLAPLSRRTAIGTGADPRRIWIRDPRRRSFDAVTRTHTATAGKPPRRHCPGRHRRYVMPPRRHGSRGRTLPAIGLFRAYERPVQGGLDHAQLRCAAPRHPRGSNRSEPGSVYG